MKRKLLSIALALTMALGMLPAAALAEETNVAEANGTQYTTLQEAIDAAGSSKTVTMLADTRENVTIAKKLTLDLNGFTLNGGTEKGKPALTVTNEVTVKDSSEAQTGTIMREDTAENSGVTSHYVIDIQGKYGFLRFESGNVKNNSGNDAAKGASLIRLGNDSVAGAYPTLTITGGTFTQNNFIAIKVDRGTLHLNGGVVNSANSYAVENWNNANIKGGTVNGTVSSWVYSTGAAFSKLTISGGQINGNVASVNYDKAADKQARIYVTGGEVNGTLGTYTYANGLVPTDVTAMATVEVTGGTFSNDPTKYVVESSAITSNGDGTYGVAKTYLAKVGETSYYTMDEAFHAAVANGETLTLLRNYTTNAVQNSGSKSFTIDLNGFTWTYTGTDTNCAAFEINYSDVTLTVKNGKIVSGSMLGLIPSAMSGSITYNNSGLVFEDVEATANGHSGIETNGNNTNDTVTLKNSTLNVPNGYGIYFPSSGTLTIDNSTINAKTMGVQVCAGSLSINEGSAITVTGDGVTKTENDGAVENGAAVSILSRNGYRSLDQITITGGSFKANGTNAAIKVSEWDNTSKEETDTFDNTNKTVQVSGGNFSQPIEKEYLDPSLNAELVSAGSDTPYSYYTDVKDASAAAKPGDTVTDLTSNDNTVTVTLNYNDGVSADAKITVVKDTTIDLPTPTRSGYRFNGWYDENNTKIENPYSVTASIELTASWTKNASSSRYNVTAPKADNGTVTVTPSRASKGDTVTVTVTPDSGYVLESITVLDKDGKELELTDKGDGKYTFTMPKGEVTVKAAFKADSTSTSFFDDVAADSYYYEAVKWAVEKGITTGIGNNLFGSNDPCTRAQIVTFLWRAAGSPEPKSLSSFTDVPADAWYAKAVAWAVENGVTAGVGDGLFGSDDTCTRAQSVTFLFKALKATAKGQADFKDVSASDWYAQAVAWAVENGVTAGVGGGLFGSGDDCTRAQIVTFLFKAYQGK